MLTKYPREGSASILILLTDGDPTSGNASRHTDHMNDETTWMSGSISSKRKDNDQSPENDYNYAQKK